MVALATSSTEARPLVFRLTSSLTFFSDEAGRGEVSICFVLLSSVARPVLCSGEAWDGLKASAVSLLFDVALLRLGVSGGSFLTVKPVIACWVVIFK